MIKAIFMDYTGTIVQEGGSSLQELIRRVCGGSNMRDPKSVVALWWKLVKGYEEQCLGETFLTEDEIVERVLAELTEKIGLREDLEELHGLMRDFWVHAPLFPDTKAFFDACPVPVYVLTNNGVEYVRRSMEEKGLHPAGIVCGDMVRAYKPHRELFEKALEVSGLRADEVLHVGDSYASDAQGALAAGIRPVLVQRAEGRTYEEVTVVGELPEVLALLKS